MSETVYKLVFNGEIAPGANPDDVRSRVGRLLNIDAARVDTLFNGRTTIIKNNLGHAEAEQYKRKFDATGAVATIEPVASAPVSAPASPQPATPPQPPLASGREDAQAFQASGPTSIETNKAIPGSRTYGIFLALFLIVGIALFGYGIFKTVKTAILVNTGTVASGTITGFSFSRSTGSHGSTTYAPEVKFRAPNGRIIRFCSQFSSNFMRYEVDEQVPVLFDHADPYRAEINAFIPLWGGAIIMLAMGAGFSWFGYYMLGCHRRALRVVVWQVGRNRGAQVEMIACPSCGFSQPATTICAVCRTDIARYREKLAYAANFSARFSGKVAMVRNIIVIVSIIAGIITFAGQMTAFRSSSVGKQVPVPWTDTDHRYEFMISVDLQVRSNKDVVADYPLLKSKLPTMYQLVVIPSAAPATVIALGISGITSEQIKSVGWDGIAAEIGSDVKVVLRDEVECHGLTLHRLGYETGGGYREDAYFEAGKHVIQVSLVSTSGQNSPQTARAREIIMNNLSGI